MKYKIQCDHDEEVDVIHINFGPRHAEYGETVKGLEDKILIMRDEATDQVVGFKLFGCKIYPDNQTVLL